MPGRESSLESERREHALSVSGAAVESTPRPRRKFSAADKLRIVKEAEACRASGERGALEALLRREAIYASNLYIWRAQLGADGTAAFASRKPGRKPKLDAKDLQISALTKQLARAEQRMHVADAIIELQKKAHALLGIALPVLDEKS